MKTQVVECQSIFEIMEKIINSEVSVSEIGKSFAIIPVENKILRKRGLRCLKIRSFQTSGGQISTVKHWRNNRHWNLEHRICKKRVCAFNYCCLGV